MNSEQLLTCTCAEATKILEPAVNNTVVELIMPDAMRRDPTRTGGLLTFWRMSQDGLGFVPVAHLSIGRIPADRTARCAFFANEKAARLADTPTTSRAGRAATSAPKTSSIASSEARSGSTTSSSSPSRGFSEEEDEAICAILADRLELVSRERIAAIQEISDNEILEAYFRDFLNKGQALGDTAPAGHCTYAVSGRRLFYLL